MDDAVDTWVRATAGAAAIGVVWAAAWSVPAIRLRRNDLADVAWGLLYPLVALLVGGIVVAPDVGNAGRATLVVVLVAAWGVRLASHIGRRFRSHDHEDKRYAKLRERWGERWRIRSVLQVFGLQAALTVVVVQPVLIAVAVHRGSSQPGWLDAVAVLLVVGGATLEGVADRSLRRFLARTDDDRPRYLTTGVWAWSRHPNYAGDAILWWGFGLFGVAGAIDAGAPWLVVPAVVGPIVMTAFLRYGSGVPMTERGRAGTPEWDAYVERTSVFLPRPPRATSSDGGS